MPNITGADMDALDQGAGTLIEAMENFKKAHEEMQGVMNDADIQGILGTKVVDAYNSHEDVFNKIEAAEVELAEFETRKAKEGRDLSEELQSEYK